MPIPGRPRVVVADDHPRVLEAATSILSESCEVVAAVGDGPSAVESTLQLHPDVVVLDISMPGLDGFQTCTQIRSSGSDARILFLSNHAGEDMVLESLARGASGFVAKPRMALDLTDAIGHVHARRSFVPGAGLLPRWNRPKHRRHDLQMFSGDAPLIEGAVSFLEAALECGDSIATFLTPAHQDAIHRQLSARGHDVARLVATNRYAPADAETAGDSLLRNGGVDPVLFTDAMNALLEQTLPAAVGSSPHLSLFGEISSVYHSRGQVEEMLQIERLAHEYVRARPISILCACATGVQRLDGSDLVATMCGEHCAIVPSRSGTTF
jgi:DNA-binding NarL/FixJ family response regulator